MAPQPKHSKILAVKNLLADSPESHPHFERVTDDEAYMFMDFLDRTKHSLPGCNICDIEDLKLHLSFILTIEEIHLFQTLFIKLYSENYDTN
jgi:hypothetical protein